MQHVSDVVIQLGLFFLGPIVQRSAMWQYSEARLAELGINRSQCAMRLHSSEARLRFLLFWFLRLGTLDVAVDLL